LTNRELFKKALEKVKALNGTAQAKDDLFEAEARQIERLTGGSWSANRFVGTNGEHVFLGNIGEMLIIDGNGQLYRSRVAGAWHQFIPPDIFSLDYSSLKPII
jgi:hypothetical protein